MAADLRFRDRMMALGMRIVKTDAFLLFLGLVLIALGIGVRYL